MAETEEEKGPRENSVFASWGGNQGTSKWSQRSEKEGTRDEEGRGRNDETIEGQGGPEKRKEGDGMRTIRG